MAPVEPTQRTHARVFVRELTYPVVSLGEERPGAGEFFPRVIVPIARVRRALGGLWNGDRGGRTEGQRGGERERNQEF